MRYLTTDEETGRTARLIWWDEEMCDLDDQCSPGSMNCNECEHHLRSYDGRRETLCTYFKGEIERQKKKIDELECSMDREKDILNQMEKQDG